MTGPVMVGLSPFGKLRVTNVMVSLTSGAVLNSL
jgi:hypothetical protein